MPWRALGLGCPFTWARHWWLCISQSLDVGSLQSREVTLGRLSLWLGEIPGVDLARGLSCQHFQHLRKWVGYYWGGELGCPHGTHYPWIAITMMLDFFVVSHMSLILFSVFFHPFSFVNKSRFFFFTDIFFKSPIPSILSNLLFNLYSELLILVMAYFIF